jgi:hypothetical protein
MTAFFQLANSGLQLFDVGVVFVILQRGYAQVLGSVVCPNSIHMVNDFTFDKSAPKGLFHHITVLQNVFLCADTKINVAALGGDSSADPAMIIGTEFRRGLGGTNRDTGRFEFRLNGSRSDTKAFCDLADVQSGLIQPDSIVRIGTTRAVFPSCSPFDSKATHAGRHDPLRYAEVIRNLVLRFAFRVKSFYLVAMGNNLSCLHTWSISRDAS